MHRWLVALGVLLLASSAFASSGVADERVVLPDGPGSIGGIGENADVDLNMGLMQTSVPFEIPEGRDGMTPDLRLTYSSGGGSSVVGIGWDFAAPAIERTTLRGLPTYAPGDEFAGAHGELVLVADEGDVRTYRARFEGAFVRYRWHDVGDGSAGYWTAEEPDGRVHYYGADETGASVDEARVLGSGGVFRYHRVATVDPYGHAIRYSYQQDGGWALLREVSYLFDEDGRPRFLVSLAYEDRPDHVSDCVSGVDLLLRKRLAAVAVISHHDDAYEVISRIHLAYEDDTRSGGASRLASVQLYGLDDTPFPGRFTFEYSASLVGGACTGCEAPFVSDVGTLPGGARLQNGRATLLDINGDALPDVLHTPDTGGHEFILSSLDPDGRPRLSSTVIESSANVGTGFLLDAPAVQAIDVDGNGFTDIVSGLTGEVRCNDASGDWSGTACMMNASLPAFEEDVPGDADPRYVRFFDYDNDKRIDVLRTTTTGTDVFHNTPQGFVAISVDDIGAVFDQDGLTLTDMNGDGLQDPAELLPDGALRYRLNLGRGRWAPWTNVAISGFSGVDVRLTELEDVNGDGLADVVAVVGNEVRYALNRNGDSFGPVQTLDDTAIPGMPERGSDTTVLFADMNANGSRDIVWFHADGRVQLLELFPLRPNLLTRMENGLGRVQVVHYRSSVHMQASSDRPWRYRLPHPMTVVSGTDTWVTLTGGEDGEGLHEEIVHTYYDGFYDGQDERFRGYGEVVSVTLAEESRDSQPARRITSRFDVGEGDVYRNGLLLEEIVEGERDGAWVPIKAERNEHGDCPLTAVPDDGLAFPVRYVCQLAIETTWQEGAPASEWKTTRTDYTYDGYGNVVLEEAHGVLFQGAPDAPTGCEACSHEPGRYGAPCGQTCAGDEQRTETAYIEPGDGTGGRWILGAATTTKRYAAAGEDAAETRSYYDGPAFQGLPLGELSHGTLTREEVLVDEGRWLQQRRYRLDAHGNVVEDLDPLGDPDDHTGHRRQTDYDPLGFRITAVRVLLTDDEGEAYALERTSTYEPSFLLPATQTDWRVIRSGAPETPEVVTRVTYDAFARPDSLARPDDDPDDPSELYIYELGDPVSRIRVAARSTTGGPFDLEQAICVDGLGRTFQTRTQVATGEVLVDGFVELNKHGNPVRTYQPYTATTLDCELAPPEAVSFSTTRYDALDRLAGEALPDQPLYGAASTTRIERKPLEVWSYDEEDAAPDSPHFDTPTLEVHDGLGRPVLVHRLLQDGARGTWRMEYDAIGRLAAITDPEGNEKLQTHDLASRLVEVRDPNAGMWSYTYDDAGNLVARVDGRGATVVSEYDGANRLKRRFDPTDEDASEIRLRYDLPDLCAHCTHPAGKLVEVTYPLPEALGETGRDSIGYDARDRRVAFSRTIESADLLVRYGWDHADRLVSTTYPDGRSLARRYDGASRLVEIEGVLDGVDYDERGLPASWRLANGAVERFSYDERMRLSAQSVRAGGVDALRLSYVRDRASRVLAVDDDSEGPLLLSHGGSYLHDDWDRVVEATFKHVGGENEIQSFDYDLLSNVTAKTSSKASGPLHVGELSYDDERPNAVSAAGAVSYRYDEAGNVIARGAQALTWDYQGRLVALDEGQNHHAYVHGAAETRVAKQDADGTVLYVTPDFEVRDGVAVVYPSVGNKRVARLEDTGLQTTLLTDLAPLDEPDGVITAADGWISQAAERGLVSGIGARASPTELLRAAARRLLAEAEPTAFLHADHLGSVVLATDEGGEVRGRRAFALDGATTATSGYVDSYGFTGQEADASGLLRFQFRSLDPVSGRWLSADPAFLWGDSDDVTTRPTEATGAYTYVAGELASAFDPTGLATHKLRVRMKNTRTNKTVIKSKKYTSGDGPGSGAKDFQQQLKTHTERKFFREYKGQITRDHKIFMKGSLDPCSTGCRPKIRRVVMNTKAHVNYTATSTNRLWKFRPKQYRLRTRTVDAVITSVYDTSTDTRESKTVHYKRPNGNMTQKQL